MPTKKATKKAVTKKTSVRKAGATKKAAAKKTPRATKKAAVKKSTGRTAREQKSLVYAPDQQSFWVSDGRILNSLVALRDALAEMEKDVYVYHATGEQNDFAAWVDQVLCDESCARDLKKAKTPKSAQTVVVRHLKLYSV